MQCPTDSTTLVMSERSGIEIDYCPSCRGVWLDRGELDKIVERSAAPATAPRGDRRDDPRYDDPRYDRRRRDDDDDEGGIAGFLGNLFG
jgi:Zn-finger nucleic acid-binding protein